MNTTPSLGRRVTLLMLLLSAITLTAVTLVALAANTARVEAVLAASFQARSQALASALSTQLGVFEARAANLAATVGNRPDVPASTVRGQVLRALRGHEREVASANVLLTGAPLAYSFDYTVPVVGNEVVPLTRVLDAASIPADAWVRAVLVDGATMWFGPGPSVWGVANGGPVVGVAHPLRGDAPANAVVGVVWLEVPLSVVQASANQLAMADADDASYALLMHDNAPVAVVQPDAEAAPLVLGSLASAMRALLSLNTLTRYNDPLRDDLPSTGVRVRLPQSGWQLLSVAPVQSLVPGLATSDTVTIASVGAAGLVMLAVVMLAYVRRNVTVPLLRLADAAQEIGSGDMRYAIEYRDRRDEVGRMARALDDMKQDLANSYDELNRWSNALEQRVERRTRELDAARRDAQAAANELRAVYDESLLVVSTYQLQTILQTLCQRILTLLDASYCAVWLAASDSDTSLRLVADTVPDREHIGRTLGPGQGVAGAAIQQGRLIVIDDYLAWPYRLNHGLDDIMHQAMAAPLLFSNTPIGAVVVGRTYDGPPFEVDDQRLLRLFANLVSPAVRNAQLFVERDAAQREAERANLVKTRFLASVTHELRTPLNLIINNLDFMRIGAFGEVNDEQVERLSQTIRSSEHLLFLINDLLDVSKIEAGEMQLFVQEGGDLRTLLEDVIDAVHMLLEPRQDAVAFAVDLPESIPTLPMDVRRVRQVLLNLLSNAVKFTARGQVRFTVRQEPTLMRFEVADTGMGIPHEEADKLFAVFERTTDAKAHGIEGTGLGLPISKFLVEAHGGSIGYTSVPGEGSTFWFTLPLRQRSASVTDSQSMTALLQHRRT